MDLLSELDARGLIHDSTDRAALSARLAEGPITLYCGFDPTADSLHVGSLVPLLLLRRFAERGHRAIALAGGATGMIGDPSGKSDERNLLDEETLRANVTSIGEQLGRLLGDCQWLLRDNNEWLGRLSLVEFLRDVGKHVTANQMVAKESVRARMEGDQGISYTEFTYMLLQGYDFLHLHESEGCELQVGGSDQWGNITVGIDLIRKRRGATAHGLTCPLITRSDGRKFGKTEEGTVWLSPTRTSPYQFFQYWMNVDDRDAARFLRLFTFLSLEELTAFEASVAGHPERREVQQRLAAEVTALVHGENAARDAAAASVLLFGGDPREASEDALAFVAGEVPSTLIRRTRLEEGLSLVDVLCESAVTSSKTDARRTLAEGGIYVNGERAAEERHLGLDDLLHGRYVLVRRGKKTYHVLTGA